MAAATIFQARSFATCAKFTAVGLTVFGNTGADGDFAVAVKMGAVFFSHKQILLASLRGSYHASGTSAATAKTVPLLGKTLQMREQTMARW
jgi:hypothetical protein